MFGESYACILLTGGKYSTITHQVIWTTFLDPEDMDDDFAHDVMADELADAYYCPDQPSVGNTELSVHLMGFFYHRNKPMIFPFRKWAHQNVRLNRSRSYYHVHHPLAL